MPETPAELEDDTSPLSIREYHAPTSESATASGLASYGWDSRESDEQLFDGEEGIESGSGTSADEQDKVAEEPEEQSNSGEVKTAAKPQYEYEYVYRYGDSGDGESST